MSKADGIQAALDLVRSLEPTHEGFFRDGNAQRAHQLRRSEWVLYVGKLSSLLREVKGTQNE